LSTNNTNNTNKVVRLTPIWRRDDWPVRVVRVVRGQNLRPAA